MNDMMGDCQELGLINGRSKSLVQDNSETTLLDDV